LARVPTYLQANDPAALDYVAGQFEAQGLVLYAAEAAATAGLAYQLRGQRQLAVAADRRASVLAARCEGAVTPALLRKPRSPLTAREEQIAALAAAGVSDKEIAERLGLSARTIHANLRNVYAKLGISGRQQLRCIFEARM
jgi:DNA-binding CsgD family transcriptional regulator